MCVCVCVCVCVCARAFVPGLLSCESKVRPIVVFARHVKAAYEVASPVYSFPIRLMISITEEHVAQLIA